MNTINQEEICRYISEKKVVSIIRGVAEDKIIPTLKAIVDGGINILEITYDHTSSQTIENTLKSMAAAKKYFGNKIFLGVGTVLTCRQVLDAKDNGACFVISPGFDEAVVKTTKENGMVSIPGAFSPSEVSNAYIAGADFVKLFPVSALGPDYVKQISAPLSHIPMLAVGGIDLLNIGDYIKTGVKGFGIGSNIADKKLINEGRFDEISRRAEAFARAVSGAGK